MVKLFTFRPNTTGQEGGSTLLDKIIGALGVAFDALNGVVTNDRLVNVAIGVTDTRVVHGLGAPPRTWEVVDQDANAVVWRSSAVNANVRQTILLVASAPVNVTLRFTL